MARNYGKKNTVRRNGSFFGQMMAIGLAFIFGYGAASIFDFAQLSTWVNAHLLAENNARTAIKTVAQQAQLPKPKFEFYTLLANGRVAGSTPSAPAVSQPTVNTPPVAAVPHELAANAHVPPAPTSVASAVEPVSSTPINLTVTQKLPTLHAAGSSDIKIANGLPATKDAYLVQVASFRNFHEADRMKGTLAMKGFVVTIATVKQQQMTWYRVIIGPFASRIQAQKAQLAFAKTEHIMGMIRKMDA